MNLIVAEEEIAIGPAREHRTDAAGRFRFEAPPGTQIEARHPQYAPGHALFGLSD